MSANVRRVAALGRRLCRFARILIFLEIDNVILIEFSYRFGRSEGRGKRRMSAPREGAA
jgi:hypothetical protein